MTPVQRNVLEELRAGAVLRLRVGSNRNTVGDFLLMRKSKVIDVVTRRTVRAICELRNGLPMEPGAKAPLQEEEKPAMPPPTAQTAVVVNATDDQVRILDDIARGMAGKAFSRLSRNDQESVRNIAARLEGK